jgi:hypothetical protein
LVDLRAVNNFSRLVLPYTTSLERFKTKEQTISYPTEAKAAVNYGIGDGFSNSDKLVSAVPAVVSTTGQQLNYAGALADAAINYSSVNELQTSAASTGAVNAVDAAAIFTRYNIPLGEIVETLLAVNKTIVFNQQLIIEIDFASGARIGFSSSTVAGVGVPTALTADYKMTEVMLYLATEQNDVVAAYLRDEAKKGMSMPIPYPVMKKTATGTSGVSSCVFRFNRTHGQKLRRVYSGWFHATETGLTACVRGNEACAVLTGIRSIFMNQPRQDYTMDISKGQVWAYMKPVAGGSVAFQSHKAFEHYFTFVDSFDGIPLIEVKDKAVYSSGINLDLDMDYALESTMLATGKQLYQYAICEKTLVWKDGFVSVV